MEGAEGSPQGALCRGVWREAGGGLLQSDLPQVQMCSAMAVRASRSPCDVPRWAWSAQLDEPVKFLFR